MTTLRTLLAQSTESEVVLEPSGMVVMGLSILLVLGLMLFCMIRILREPTPEDHHHAPLDIDTRDREV
jgi:hypothetical protein